MPSAPVLFVLAGVNGAGKSSIGGAWLREQNIPHFNPDEIAGRIRQATGCTIEKANALAWREGKQRLEAAIASRSGYAFETTLGGKTITGLLELAAASGFEILVWFAGLATPDQHIARVRARVARGGHDIPDEIIRERWDTSRRNLIRLLPLLTELRLFDNSREGDPSQGTIPAPRLLLHYRTGAIVTPSPGKLAGTPDWAKPIVMRAIQLHDERS